MSPIIDRNLTEAEARALLTTRREIEAQGKRATLDDHCEHPADNLNAAKSRCLACGMWVVKP